MAAVTYALILGLAAAQLSWIGRSDQIGDILPGFMGGFVGIVGFTWFNARSGRQKPPRRHSVSHLLLLGCPAVVVWLLFITVLFGGFTSGAIVPALVLGLTGAVALVVLTRVATPELVL